MVDLVLLTVTILSLAFAAAMGLVTWRVLRLDRRRSDARVAALSAAADESRDDIDALPAPPLFAARTPAKGGGLVAGVAIAAAGLIAIAAIGLRTVASATVPPSPESRDASPPLELLWLEHKSDGGRLGIHGLVKNPAGGTQVDGLVAVLYLFDRSGVYLGAARAPIAESRLGPGGASRFRVPVPEGPAVGRYRLTFEASARPVPHVDRRGGTGGVGPSPKRTAFDARAGSGAEPGW